MREPARSTAILDNWCSDHIGRASQLADACGVSRQLVSMWRKGKCRPDPKLYDLIEATTAGRVKARGWLLPGEAARQKEIEEATKAARGET